MKPTLCSRCKKNVAVVFITRLDPNGKNSHNEGLCLKCARELNIRPVTDMIEKMGLSDEELEGLTNEMMSAFDGTESMQDLIGNITESLRDVAGERDDDEDEEEGRTATFPFLHRLMGNMNGQEEKKDETPAPSRGEIQVIGATTLVEYRKYIEKDSALERRFQPVIVNEPSIEDAVEIIKGVAPYYEEFHHVKISPDIARLAVLMSERYITDRFLPDKAIDLIDEACSDVNLRDKDLARKLELQKELDDIAVEREVMVADASDKAYERLAELRSKELQLLQEQKELSTVEAPSLTLESLSRVVELWTKIPASTIQEQEYERLAKLEDRLKAHVVGQDEAIAAVSAAIRRNRVGVASKRKPVSFIFVGSTGVGKTELVKQLAQDLFHSPESLIRLDMSEFMEKHSVSRIIGSPPGYVGYDEAGQLTEKIRRKPYSVVLFDEIEKAHPDVLNILLQILDDGHITDAQGRTVNFENTVIVMTSNAGSESSSGPLGFGKTVNEQSKDKAMKALQQFLRPEFLNRVDEVICFNQLSEENFRAIARIMLKELQDVLKEKDLDFTWDEAVLDQLVKDSYSAAYGARNLRRHIQKALEDPIATKIIDSYLSPIHALKAVVEDGKILITAL